MSRAFPTCPCTGSGQCRSALTTAHSAQCFTLSPQVATHRKWTFACLQTLWPQYSWKHARPSQGTVPSSNSSKSSTKNSFRGGRFGLFSVFSSCWILEDTLLFTGTPVKGRAEKDCVMPWPLEPTAVRSDDQLARGPTDPAGCWSSQFLDCDDPFDKHLLDLS